MKPEVREALLAHIETRRAVLESLGKPQRMALIEVLIRDFFAEQRRVLMKWSTLTGQSAQIDTGYIAQHMASIVLAIPGQGFKGKGLDLVDGSEVKSAAILGGVDRPRWNHNMGTLASDEARKRRGLPPAWSTYLDAAPAAFYVLFDRVVRDDSAAQVLRVRGWCVDARADAAWRSLFEEYVANRSADQYNLQLHPPVGYDDDVVVNTIDNLDFSDVKVLEARFTLPDDPSEGIEVTWELEPPASVLPIAGRARRIPYGGRGARPSRLEGAAGHALEVADLGDLFPEVEGLSGVMPAEDPAAPDLADDDAG